MRICICGLHRADAVKNAEDVLGVQSINVDYPGMEDNEYKLFHYAAESFKYFNNKNVIFDGGVFDCFKSYSDDGWVELQEQVILSTIENLDIIAIVIRDMDEKTIDFCKSFAQLYPKKVLLFEDETKVSIKA